MTDPAPSSTEVVVGVDGSQASLAALDWAVARRDRLGPVRPVMSWQFPWVVFVPAAFGGVNVPPPTDMQVVTEQALSEVLAAHGSSGLLDPEVEQGNPAAVLIEVADREGAGAIVVGTRGHGGFAGLVLGSTSAHCAEHSPVPVVIVPPPHEGESYARTGPERIVVGIDGSVGSQRALRFALDDAAPGDTVTAVTSWDIIPVMGYESLAVENVDLTDSRKEMLTRTIDQVRQPGDVTVISEVEQGDPRVLLRERGRHADLLVIGARGEGLLPILIGSVAHAVVHHPACPIAVIPADDRERRHE